MGVNYSNNSKSRNTKKKEDLNNPGMTIISCRKCQRVLGRVYSTNGFITCDKCGCRSYVRIYGGVTVTLPAEYLDRKGYYALTDEYIHQMRDLINGEQIEIENPYDEIR